MVVKKLKGNLKVLAPKGSTAFSPDDKGDSGQIVLELSSFIQTALAGLILVHLMLFWIRAFQPFGDASPADGLAGTPYTEELLRNILDNNRLNKISKVDLEKICSDPYQISMEGGRVTKKKLLTKKFCQIE